MSFREAFFFWLKLGFVSFGGPAGQISLMHEALVTRRAVISEERFLHALNFCMLLPGPEAQQLATYLGWLMHRTWGGLIAGLFFILPSFFILVGISTLYVSYGTLPLVQGLFEGVQAAVLALVLQASIKIGTKTLKNRGLWGIAGLSLVAVSSGLVPFPAIILGAATLGFMGKSWVLGASTPSKTESSDSPDHASWGSHTQFHLRESAKVIALGLLAWGVPILGLMLFLGVSHPLTQMGFFFSKMALLTFGGAYAVLPYVFEATVHHFHWLTLPQMMDGMGLGETTPGPLIMVVTYVGFVAGYTHHFLESASLFWSGFIAAAIATGFTFLPSFIFIFAGAPLIESTHQSERLTAPMRAITAAVVGVIFHLALFFGFALLFPGGLSGPLHLQALIMSVSASIALSYFKVPSIPVIAVLGLLGIVLHGGVVSP